MKNSIEQILVVIDEGDEKRRLEPVTLSPAASMVLTEILKHWIEAGLAWPKEEPSQKSPTLE